MQMIESVSQLQYEGVQRVPIHHSRQETMLNQAGPTTAGTPDPELQPLQRCLAKILDIPQAKTRWSADNNN